MTGTINTLPLRVAQVWNIELGRRIDKSLSEVYRLQEEVCASPEIIRRAITAVGF